ncbi:MAG: ribonuclease HII [Candidatus Hydrogenedentales bacterium]|jgi:ribonuclease HII
MSKSLPIHRFMSTVTGCSFTEQQRLCAMLSIENSLWCDGFSNVAGVDEAGRGPLAGPIVAAAVILSEPIPGLNDSKQLTETSRQSLYNCITGGTHVWACASISASEIDRMGIQQANYLAMRKAMEGLSIRPDFLLVDGYNLAGIAVPTMRVVKGDSRSLTIAAASVVAKVTRDTFLRELDTLYPGYGFARNKGYGTLEHRRAIETLGPCPEHRRSFAPFTQKDETNETTGLL